MDNRNFIDMAPYEDQFTKLERLFFERNAVMNIVAYMSDKHFTDAQYQRVFNDYLKASKAYESYTYEFENTILMPLVEGPFHWEADFERRVIYVS
jgi:hypothetical protein